MRTSFDVFDAFVRHKANEKIRRGNTYGEWRVLGVSNANNKQLKLKQSDCITPLKMSIHIQLLTANMPYKCAFCIHVSKFSTERKSQRKTHSHSQFSMQISM